MFISRQLIENISWCMIQQRSVSDMKTKMISNWNRFCFLFRVIFETNNKTNTDASDAIELNISFLFIQKLKCILYFIIVQLVVQMLQAKMHSFCRIYLTSFIFHFLNDWFTCISIYFKFVFSPLLLIGHNMQMQSTHNTLHLYAFMCVFELKLM